MKGTTGMFERLIVAALYFAIIAASFAGTAVVLGVFIGLTQRVAAMVS